MITAQTDATLAALEGLPLFAQVRGSIRAFGILEGPDEQDVWRIRNEETGERFGFFSRSVDNFTTIDGLPAVVFP